MASWTCSASGSSPHSNCALFSSPPSDIDLLGGPVFAFVQTDLRNNIAVRPPPPIPRTPPARPFFVLNVLHSRGYALGTMLTSQCRKRSRTSFGQRRGRAGTRAQLVWSA